MAILGGPEESPPHGPLRRDGAGCFLAAEAELAPIAPSGTAQSEHGRLSKAPALWQHNGVSTQTVTPLLDRLPADGDTSSDTLLEIFVDWVTDRGLELYPAQEDAIIEILAGRHVVLNTPTGSGKSLVAQAMQFMATARGQRSFYTSPVKALVSEKFFSLCKDFGASNVGMLTGDASINRDAPIICCTAEILSNMALREGNRAKADYAILDEFHYYSDRDRGVAWQIPLLTLNKATFLLMSATLGDVSHIVGDLEVFTDRECAVVKSSTRPVPLSFEYREVAIHEAIAELTRTNRAPIYVVSFTHRACADHAQSLTSVNLTSKPEKQQIGKALSGVRFDSPYGKDVRRFLQAGIGLHHAGLLPKYRLLAEQLSQQGLLKVISGTDTLGVGVNIPIRTVLFTKLTKFDGRRLRRLTVRDFKQIAGRAGRKGFDDQGWVVCLAPEHVVENKRQEAARTSSGRSKNFKRRQPPKGFVAWNADTFKFLIDGDPEALSSHFGVSHGMMLNLLQREPRRDAPGGGYGVLVDLIEACHEHPGGKRRMRRSAAVLFRSLRKAGVVEVKKRAIGPGHAAIVRGDLQRDFSLFHALSLYLVEAIKTLDPLQTSYALDVVSLVEAIQEDPMSVLSQQVNKLRTLRLAELKADGVPFDERIEALDEITYPRPNEELIYEIFTAFSTAHPWVAGQTMRPKSIARDLYERYASFDEYVREYNLQRSEGVLLRYLSETYKILMQTIPRRARSQGFLDVIGYLRAMLQRVDASLVQEWERLRDEQSDGPPAHEPGGEGLEVDESIMSLDFVADPQAFAARVRAEMHRLVKALSVRNFEEAELCTRQTEWDPWTAERFRDAIEPYFEIYDTLIFDHRARFPTNTQIRKTGNRRWRVRQVVLTPDEENDWYIEGTMDLRVPPPADSPLVAVRYVGH